MDDAKFSGLISRELTLNQESETEFKSALSSLCVLRSLFPSLGPFSLYGEGVVPDDFLAISNFKMF